MRGKNEVLQGFTADSTVQLDWREVRMLLSSLVLVQLFMAAELTTSLYGKPAQEDQSVCWSGLAKLSSLLKMDAFSTLTKGAITLLERHMLLEQLVVRELMAGAAEQEPLAPEQIEQAQQMLLQKYKVSDQKGLEELGIDPDLALWHATLPLKLQSYGARVFAPKTEARFLERKNDLDRVVYSLLRVKNADLAQELFLRIAEGESTFADLATQFSEGPEKDSKGIVGPVPLTNAHPILAEWLRTSRPGEVRSPLRIETWFLVSRLEAYTPATFDASTQNQMAQELFQAWAQEEAGPRIRELKAMDTQEGN